MIAAEFRLEMEVSVQKLLHFGSSRIFINARILSLVHLMLHGHAQFLIRKYLVLHLGWGPELRMHNS